MAAEDRVVRITYQELKEIVDASEPVKAANVGEDTLDNHDRIPPQSKRFNKKDRRPAQALYRPGQLRQGSETRTDGTADQSDKSHGRGSKRESVEKQFADVTDSSSTKFESGDVRQGSVDKNADFKRRGKRPDLQIYKPRVKNVDKDRRSEEKDSPSSSVTTPLEDEENSKDSRDHQSAVSYPRESGPSGSLPRRVQVKSQEGRMQVTVKNSDESMSSSQISESGREFSSRRREGSKGRGGGENSNRYPSDKGMRGFRRMGSGGNQDNRNASAFKSYSKSRRSNSIESLNKDREDGSNRRSGKDDGYSYSSETFPRTKSGAKKAMSSSREMLNSGSGKGGGRDSDKLYLGVTRPRTGSVSSEASVASFNSNNGSFYSGSSDWYTEEEEPEHIADWGAEVEKAHLEELARLVHHGAQELTSSLNTYEGEEKESTANDQQVSASMSVSQTDVFSEKNVPHPTEKNIRNRSKRRHRRRKTSSQYSSRDSSVHSSIHGDDDNYSERGGYRRRRRHNSGRSQSGRQENDGSHHGLQVTIGGGQNNNRHVELNNSNREGRPSQHQHHHQFIRKDQHHGGRGGNMGERPKWEKDTPPRFRKDSGGHSSGVRVGKGRGRGHAARTDLMSDGEGGASYRRERLDRRSEDPAHDASNGNFSRQNYGKGRVIYNNRRGSWDETVGDVEGPTNPSSRNNRNQQVVFKKDKERRESVEQQEQQQQQQSNHQGIIHLPTKVNISCSQQSEQQQYAQSHHMSGATASPPSYPHHQLPATSNAKSSSTHHHHPMANKSSGNCNRGPIQGQKQLFDPNNPSKPIVIPGTTQHQPSSPTIVPNFQDPEGLSLSPSPGSTGMGLSPSPDTCSSPKPPYHPQVPPMFYPPMYPGFRPPMMPPFPPQGPYPMGPHGPFPQGAVPSHMFYRFPGMPSPADMASFYNSDLDGDGNGSSRAQCHMMAEQILRDSGPFESQLGNILSRRPLSEDSERMLNQIRFELQNRLEQVILMDIEVANKRNVEQALWKSVYYQIIEAHRKRMAEQPEDRRCKERLVEVLNEGHRFFESLIQKLQANHRFELDVFTDGNRIVPDVNRNVKLALLSAQRVMMFLGDIARYKEQVTDTANYGKARNWYLKAQKLHPRNGRPYNQLAILAVYTKRKLDAVYYYMRSLAASNPIMTARESLMSLFDEVRRKVEVVEKKRLDERRQRLERHHKRKSMGARLEIWCSPDGVQTQGTVDEKEDEEDLSALSVVELNKRFVLTYLNVHGKLFTKINFEGFAESSSLMLLEFETLLQHSPCVMSSTRLLQLMGINMFSIDNTALKDESLEASCRSVLQEHAVQIGLEMFGLLVKRASDLLSSQMERKKKEATGADGSSGNGKGEDKAGVKLHLDEDLHQMMPALKTWVDWMMCHAQLWNPQPFNRPPELGPDIDVWQNLARLCDLLNNLEKGQITVTREQLPDMEPVVLLEDSMLAGFVPMLSAPQEVFYVDKNTDKRQSEDWLRIEKLSLFGEYLCGVEPPMLSFDVDSNKYQSVAPRQLAGEEEEEETGGGNPMDELVDEFDDVEIEPTSEEEGGGEDAPQDSIQRLKLKKAELSRKRVEQERSKESMEAIVASHRHAKIELEIHPIFLIPDTNCFIDHFPALKAILHSKKFTLVVPLVVINELDGLARGSRDDQYPSVEHAQMVKKQATATIVFLEEEFDKKHPHLRAQTSKGSVLETISFRSEEGSVEGINDDIILSCCLHYCKDKAREFMPKSKDSAVRLYREVVLLTEDRNLRLKAHSCNVPVQDVPRFKKWSKIR